MTKTLAVLYEDEIPDNIDEIVEEMGGDFYHIENDEEGEDEFGES
jgi:hypothetical protein